MTTFPRLPPDRELNPDEARGFNMALGCLISWSGQIAAQGAMLGVPDPVHNIRLMQDRAQFTAGLCQALHLTIGAGKSMPARAANGPSGPASPPFTCPAVDGRPGQQGKPHQAGIMT